MQQGGIILGMQKDKWNKEFRVKKNIYKLMISTYMYIGSYVKWWMWGSREHMVLTIILAF